MTTEKKKTIWLIILSVLCGILLIAVGFGYYAGYNMYLALDGRTDEVRAEMRDRFERMDNTGQSENGDPDLPEPVEPDSTEDNPAARAVYEAQCQEISYEALSRGGDTLIRQYYTFTGKILQVMDGHYRLGVGAGYSDVIYLDYTLPTGAERLLEDDYLTVWGQSLGLYTYTTVSDKEVTVPRLLVRYAERLTAEEVAEQNTKHYETLTLDQTGEYAGCTITLQKALIRPATEEDFIEGMSADGMAMVYLMLDCMNSSDSETTLRSYDFNVWIDGYRSALTYDRYEQPEGWEQLSYEELEPGYGVRGYVPVLAPADFRTIELRAEDEDGTMLRFFVDRAVS